MAIRTTIDLPLKPHLKKYLLCKLKTTDDDVQLTFNDQIGFGMYLSETLIKKRQFHYLRQMPEINRFCNELGDESSVRVHLKDYHFRDTGVFLTPDKIYYINKFLEKIFRNELFTCINTQIQFYPHVVITIAIDDFLSWYMISEDDLQKSTVYKIYHRHKAEYSYLKRNK